MKKKKKKRKGKKKKYFVITCKGKESEKKYMYV